MSNTSEAKGREPLIRMRERISTTVTIEAPFSGKRVEVSSIFVVMASTIPRQPAEPGAMLEIIVDGLRRVVQLPVEELMARHDACLGTWNIAGHVEKLRAAVECSAYKSSKEVAREMARLRKQIEEQPVSMAFNFQIPWTLPQGGHLEVRCGKVPVKLYLYGLESREIR